MVFTSYDLNLNGQIANWDKLGCDSQLENVFQIVNII